MAIDKPNSISSKAVADVDSPNTFISKVPDKSASCALIGYENLLIATTTSAAQVMLIPNTYERYSPGVGAETIKFQLIGASLVDFVAIGAHNAGFQNVDITVSYATSVGGSLTTLGVMQFDDNGAFMLSFSEVSAAEIAITFTGTSALELGVIYAGKALVMQQPIYGGHAPIDLQAKTDYENVISETGQFLGRNITMQGTETSFNWRHLGDDWIRSTFKPFINSAKRLPFFIKWRPDLYDTAVFGFSTDDIKPKNMGGGHKLMSVSFTMRGHAD